MNRLILLAMALFVFQVSADVPKLTVTEQGAYVLTVPVFDYYGARNFGEVVLYPDGHYSYTANPWECEFGPHYDAKKEACEAK